MLVSWNWLQQYLPLEMPAEELAQRLSLSGLNHEGSTPIGNDLAIDLEVTSNRGDCLGHIGVAREIGVLYDLPLKTPDPAPAATGPPIAEQTSIENEAGEACPRYTARLIRGVKVGPSPAWLIERLQSVFWKKRRDGKLETYQPINNIADITNYVLMECGQPLHAFDFDRLAGPKIRVRHAANGETLEAIDHKSYPLHPSMCVIADAEKPVAIAGVMGGAGSEVTEPTTNVLIEAAIFQPLSIRRTARRLKLHSPSSYRFERRVDPVGVDWASRRCCDLILELAGGTLSAGVLDTNPDPPVQPAVPLRLSQIERILGIQVPAETVQQILSQLGCVATTAGDSTQWQPPSWRHDLTREADLIEEVARIHGYDKIPEDSPVPVAASAKRPFDAATEKIRHVLTAAGISEAMTPSIVTQPLDEMLSPWTDRPALETDTPMLEGARRLRRTLLPSLLQGRALNWSAASRHAELFEIAHTYLPGQQPADLPTEQYTLAIAAGDDFYRLKGIVETLLQRLGTCEAAFVPQSIDGLTEDLSVEVRLEDRTLGYLGLLSEKLQQQLKLPSTVALAELSLPVLLSACRLVPQFQPVSPYPTVTRDLNFVVGEQTQWAQLRDVVRAAVGNELTAVRYQETYRNADKDGQDRKRILLSIDLQRPDATLTGDEADALVQSIVAHCGKRLDAQLLDG